MGQLDHFMPLYVGDYLRDTPHLSVEEHGAYLLLLMALWTKGTLPASPDALARVARVTPYRWAKLAPILMPFFTVADGMLRHKRVDSERSHSIEVAGKRSAAGKAGGEAKALKTQEAALANATILPQQKATIHIHNHSHKEEREKTESPRESRAPGASALLSILKEVLDEDRAQAVIDHRKRLGRGKGLTERSARILANRLRACPDPAAAADELIVRGWTSVSAEWLQPRAPPNGNGHAKPTMADIWRASQEAAAEHERKQDAEPRLLDFKQN